MAVRSPNGHAYLAMLAAQVNPVGVAVVALVVALQVWALVVCFMKGRTWLAVLGFFVPSPVGVGCAASRKAVLTVGEQAVRPADVGPR